MTDKFELDARLADTSFALAEWPLCDVRLVDDARWPWLLLVPRRAGVVELFDLSPEDRTQLVEESAKAAALLVRAFPCDKTNVATLGNQVNQMHMHVIARLQTDAAWPNPIWGIGETETYAAAAKDAIIARLTDLLHSEFAPND